VCSGLWIGRGLSQWTVSSWDISVDVAPRLLARRQRNLGSILSIGSKFDTPSQYTDHNHGSSSIWFRGHEWCFFGFKARRAWSWSVTAICFRRWYISTFRTWHLMKQNGCYFYSSQGGPCPYRYLPNRSQRFIIPRCEANRTAGGSGWNCYVQRTYRRATK
jgi:hypothetical protein